MIDTCIIRKVQAFSSLSDETISKISKIAVDVTLKKGETLFWEKDQVDAVYALISGKTAMLRYSGSGQKRIFFILNEGALINEVAFDNLPVSVVCEAFENAHLLRMPKLLFLEIMREDFDLTYNVMCSMGKKQRRLYRQLKNTVPIKVDKKLAAKLWKLSKDYGITNGQWIRIDLKMSVTNLSYLMGSSRETISRALNKLIDLGIVKWDKKQILVKEKEILEYYRSE
ncbi:Crp/Fnr family transcriptional regulator [Fusibacter sp. JL216-2]|uniref:Crp/Fnr family transcriptional regulator n=1 Tax=Fusibacter sp. JL216-2 TaxID=3071453 RepID=UPI003D349E8B